MTTRPSDLTPLVDLTAQRGTGPARARRPLYVDLLPPCNHACPAGENIQAWLDHARAGRHFEAWQTLVRDNPLPAVHGRVCYHPCESACNRESVDSAVSVHAVERFLGDLANERGWEHTVDRPPTGRRVLVVGAGPSGLSVAYHLARLGHEVEVRDAGPAPGGMLHFGIPAYRLPREALLAEVSRIEAMGVAITLNHRVEDLVAEREAGGFDAVYLAIGAHLARRVDIPARDAARMLDAVSVLRDAEQGRGPELGRRVVVYGGGNTAMDAARTARRLGAHEPIIVYRRDRAQMKAHDFEADEAIAEGVTIRWLSTISQVAGTDVVIEKMALDGEGRLQPTGEMETLKADSVILAVGQVSDSTFLRNVPGLELAADGSLVVGPDGATGHPGVFAGGDLVPGEKTVAAAVGQGKRAARYMNAWLAGGVYEAPPKHPVVTFGMLHLPLFTDAEPSTQAELPAAERVESFVELRAGLSEQEARYEAQRCFSCGNCYECDHCYAACPEDAIVKLGPGRRYRFEYDVCTGCAVCFEQCPCHAIEMIPEPPPPVTPVGGRS